MNFVNPWFFVGALAASVPILLHLIKRERAQKYEFPSLMYLRKISKKTIRYQKLRHLLLLLLRVLAFLFIALAFTRPFRPVPQVAAASGRVARAHIIAVDNSLSMGYGDRWSRAHDAAARIARSAQPGDKLVLLDFSDRTTARTEITGESGAVLDGISRLELTDRPTRYGQALRTAEKFALEAGAGKRTIYLISDFQKSGTAADEQDFRLGSGIELERVDLGSDDFSNLAIGDVRVIQGEDPAENGVSVKFSVVNYGNHDRNNVRVTLSMDGRIVNEKRADIPKGSVHASEFQLPGVAPGQHPVVLEVDDPQLTRDNRFGMVLETRGKTPVLSVESIASGRGGRSPSFFLQRALNVSQLSPYRLVTTSPQKFEAAGSGGGSLVVWHVAPGESPVSANKLRQLVTNGGGAIVVIPDPAQSADFNRSFGPWLPVRAGGPAEGTRSRPGEDYALLTDVKLDHAIFRPFSEPHSGTFSTARFYRHARLEIKPPAEALARFDNGDPALVMVPYEKGRVLVFPSSADDRGNDLPLKPAFAPFWQQMLRFLENFREGRNWIEVGDTISPRNALAEAALRQAKGALDANQAIAVVDPQNQRIPASAPGESIQVDRTGFYSIKSASLSTSIAVNPVPRESDLTHADSEQWVAGWSSAGAQQAKPTQDELLTPEQQDRTRRIWRYLLAAALVIFITEGLVANSYILKPE